MEEKSIQLFKDLINETKQDSPDANKLDQLFLFGGRVLQNREHFWARELQNLARWYIEFVPTFAPIMKGEIERKGSPLLSIITSVFNCDRYIDGYLQNVVSQVGFELFEQIFVICGEQAKARKKIDDAKERNPNIRSIQLDVDPGLYEAWNIGIKEANGRFISNGNTDDRKSPIYYAYLLKLILDKGVDVCSSSYWTTEVLPEQLKDNDIMLNWFHKKKSYYFSITDFVEINEQGQMRDFCVPGPMPIWAKRLHREFGFFDEINHGPVADFAFWIDIFSKGATGYWSELPLGFYLKHQSSYARRQPVTKYIDQIMNEQFLV